MKKGGGGIMAAAGSFMLASLEQMVPWLIVMLAVIVCDLITGCRKSLLAGERVRPSRAFRETMGKCVTYFSFVITMVLIDEASGGGWSIDKWTILLICFIEVCSIVSNILKPMGYRLNAAALLALGLKRLTGETKELIVKEEEKEE
jgi:hypothetical protein